MTILHILNHPEYVWNNDEICLLDLSKTKVIESCVTSSSGRENVTIMAGINASGEKLLLLLFCLKERNLGVPRRLQMLIPAYKIAIQHN